MVTAGRRFVAAAAGLALAVGCGAPPPPTPADRVLRGDAFGTRWLVRLRGPAPADLVAVRSAIEAELDDVDRAMSSWRADSEISRLNASDELAVPVSAPLAEVLEASLAIHSASGGALDVTIAPLLRLFGFGPDGDPASAAPAPEAVEEVRARMGSARLALDRSAGGPAVLRRAVPGIEVDLSAVAKGYAVDRVSARLSALGSREHLVEVGGEIAVRGRFRVGVEPPLPWLPEAAAPGGAAPVHRSLPVQNEALATSGGYRDFRPASGTDATGVWTHILDPRAARPVERARGSVTVIAPTCLEADAWATALYVLGPEEGLALATGREIAALFLTAGPDGQILETTTPTFPLRTGNPGS